jgi:hypothetical protein
MITILHQMVHVAVEDQRTLALVAKVFADKQPEPRNMNNVFLN